MIKVFIVASLLFGLFSVKAQELSWQEYKNKYFKNDSFIIDPYNNNRVTSESQGYGMVLAVIYDDKDTFYKLWIWTKLNMLREDYLFSWQYNNAVVDKNNATDGDLLIAYALRLAYLKWKNEEYLEDYNKIKNSVKRLNSYCFR
jgi:Endoglucanase Y